MDELNRLGRPAVACQLAKLMPLLPEPFLSAGYAVTLARSQHLLLPRLARAS